MALSTFCAVKILSQGLLCRKWIQCFILFGWDFFFLCHVKMALMWFPATTESDTPFLSSVNMHASA